MSLAAYILEKYPEHALADDADRSIEDDALAIIKDLEAQVAYLKERESAVLEAKAKAVSPKKGDLLLLCGVDNDDVANEWFDGLRALHVRGELPAVVAVVLPTGMDLEHVPDEARQRFIANLQGTRS